MAAGALAGLVAIKLERSRGRRAAVTLYLVSRALQYASVRTVDWYADALQAEADQLRGRSLVRAQSQADVASCAAASAKERKGQQRHLLQPMSAPARAGRAVTWPAAHVQRVWRAQRIVGLVRACAPAALMSASCGALVLVLFFHTDVLPRGYLGFLGRASGYDRFYPGKAASALKSVAHAVAQGGLGGRIPAGMRTRDFLATLPLAADLLPAARPGLSHGFVGCGIFHPQTTSCTHGALGTVLRCLPVAMSVYAPLNASVLLLFKRSQLLANPRAALWRLVKSSVRSSVFFTLLIGCILNGSCAMRALLGGDSRASYVVTGLVGGALAVLVEQPSRRVELAMYCFLRALEGCWDAGVVAGRWRNVRHAEVALFAAAMGVLMSIYQNHPETIGLTYRSVLTRMFGKN
ncbi:hypothetical protein GGF37_006898 [Kickxella alabastrina]|nr:hypothetical protein GGF37_006898 [Kickxella alabastrina]